MKMSEHEYYSFLSVCFSEEFMRSQKTITDTFHQSRIIFSFSPKIAFLWAIIYSVEREYFDRNFYRFLVHNVHVNATFLFINGPRG